MLALIDFGQYLFGCGDWSWPKRHKTKLLFVLLTFAQCGAWLNEHHTVVAQDKVLHPHIVVQERNGEQWVSAGAQMPQQPFRLDENPPPLEIYVGCKYQWFDPLIEASNPELLSITVDVPIGLPVKQDGPTRTAWTPEGPGRNRLGYNSYFAELSDVRGGQRNATQALYFMPSQSETDHTYDIYYHVWNSTMNLKDGQFSVTTKAGRPPLPQQPPLGCDHTYEK